MCKQAVTREFLSSHELLVAPSVRRAKELLKKHRFDVVLVDYDLDDGKGDEVASHIREMGPTVKIVAVSSHEEGNRLLLAAGANAVCKKSEFRNILGVIAGLSPPMRLD